VIKLTGVEVQPVRRRVVPELFTVHQLAGVTAVQLAVGFVVVLDLATQFVGGAGQFAGGIVFTLDHQNQRPLPDRRCRNETDLAGTAKHHCQLDSAAHDRKIAMNQFAILYGD
jgi:hypothetical protein